MPSSEIVANPELSKYYINNQRLYGDANSPLYDAQKLSDRNRISRRPMIFEFYLDQETPISIEMYINPQRMQFSSQKIIGKTPTRGGIFYHHWGEDHPTMQLSGTVGLSGMKGIEQLEKIYHYSGTLLKYRDIGMHYGTLTDTGKKVLGSNIENKSNSLSSRIKSAGIGSDVRDKLDSDAGLLDFMEKSAGYQQNSKDLSLDIKKYYDTYLEVSQKQQEGIVSRNNLKNVADGVTAKTFKGYHDSTINNISRDIVDSLINYGKLSAVTNSEDIEDYDKEYIIEHMNSVNNARKKIMSEHSNDVQEMLDNWSSFGDTMVFGWEDISDQILDLWRPRQVFIYFEDRVYIGFFNSFNWIRVAEHPLINYDISFTVTRKIILTSNS